MRAKEFTINIPIDIKINGDGEPEIGAGEELVEPTSTMVSPLQQELELLKLDQGIDNNVDEFAAQHDPDVTPMEEPAEVESCEPLEYLEYGDELEKLKSRAGIGEEQAGPYNYAKDLKSVSINPRKNAAIAAHRHNTPKP